MRELLFQADQHTVTSYAVDGLALHRPRLNRRGRREAALEQNLVEQVFGGAPLLDVVNMQFELVPECIRRGCLRCGVPYFEIGGCQLQHAKAFLRLSSEIELACCFLLMAFNRLTDALFCDVGNGLQTNCKRSFSASLIWVARLGELNNDESVTSLFFIIELENCLRRHAGPAKKIKDYLALILPYYIGDEPLDLFVILRVVKY